MAAFTSFALGIGAAAAAASTGLSIAGAKAQNKALSKYGKGISKAAAIQIEQVGEQAELERQKARLVADQVRGRLRVAAAERGALGSGSLDALFRQTATDEALNIKLIDTDLERTEAAIAAGAQGASLQAKAQMINPLLAGFTGLLGGLQTGLSITGGIQDVFNPNS